MNRLTLRGCIWIASDIHLAAHTPHTRHAFHEFLDRAQHEADALILCGDLFDAWIGDDFALSDPPSWLDDTLKQLQAVAARIPLWIGRGNRDFLIGTPLMQRLGTHLLPDPCLLLTDCGEILLGHGDQYCTADLRYQSFRRLVREPLVQGAFLSLSLGLRSRIADWARSRSKASTRRKRAEIMDVTPAAIENAFRRSGVRIMVHGHTHRPALHRQNIDGRECTRIVLPDWDYENQNATRGGWLTVDKSGPMLTSLAQAGANSSAHA